MQAGFYIASLVLFNLAIVLHKLLIPPFVSLNPTSTCLEIPKIIKKLHCTIGMLEQDDHEIQTKINKAATTAFTKRLILKKDN